MKRNDTDSSITVNTRGNETSKYFKSCIEADTVVWIFSCRKSKSRLQGLVRMSSNLYRIHKNASSKFPRRRNHKKFE